jgi:putative ABC transport system ATP-binding protein
MDPQIVAQNLQHRPPPIFLSDVYKSYQRGGAAMPVLRGIQLEVKAGQCLFLVGPSGSGKSTLLSILGCILTPDQGQVRLFGNDVQTLDEHARVQLRRHGIGFVFQRFQLIRGLTALENVTVPLVLQGKDAKQLGQRGMALLGAVGLSKHMHVHPGQLSAGQCQRVALARALAGDPSLLLADEPTAALDAENGHEIMNLLRRLTIESGKTVVVVTHDQRILPYADRVCRMEEGRLVEIQKASRPAAKKPVTFDLGSLAASSPELHPT